MRLIARWNARHSRNAGQIIVLFALYLLVLIVIIGLAVDLGFAYVTRGELSKAVDAAALEGLNNINLGTVTATSVASATFAANYAPKGKPGRDLTAISPNIVFSTDSNTNTTITVSAQTQIKTFFVGLLPGWSTLTVGTSNQATRAKLIVELVLDRSGSMGTDGGGAAMPGAVSGFLGAFDDNSDKAGLVTFASSDTNNVPITQPFIATINKDVAAIFPSQCTGSTFSQGGLTDALVEIQAATLSVPTGQTVVKAVVFFTDGFANEIQASLHCDAASTTNVIWNFGGFDVQDGDNVKFFVPGVVEDPGACQIYNSCSNPGQYPSCDCPGTNSYASILTGTQEPFCRANITADAENNCIQLANQMRATSNIVYSIGMGNDLNQEFLEEVANDPSATNYVATGFDGEFIYAQDASELPAVFERVAEKILLRLTQ